MSSVSVTHFLLLLEIIPHFLCPSGTKAAQCVSSWPQRLSLITAETQHIATASTHSHRGSPGLTPLRTSHTQAWLLSLKVHSVCFLSSVERRPFFHHRSKHVGMCACVCVSRVQSTWLHSWKRDEGKKREREREREREQERQGEKEKLGKERGEDEGREAENERGII